MIKACIFDMDGVIVDSAKYHFIAWRKLASNLSIDFTEEQNEGLKGLSRVDSLEKILNMGQLELDSKTKQQLMNQKNTHYLELISHMSSEEVLPGVRQFIEELKSKNYKVGLGSSSKNARTILQTVELIQHFDAIIDGNGVTFSKPDPEVFIKGAKYMNLEPCDCVVFEDAQAGVQAALAGGFQCVGIGDPQSLDQAHHVMQNFIDFSVAELSRIF